MRKLSAATLMCLALAGCGTPAPTPPVSSPTGGQPAAAPTATAAPPAAPADPCTGIGGCREVATVDVSGDGTPDRVGVSVVRRPPPDPQVVYGGATVTVSVATDSTVHRIDIDSSGILPGSDADPQPYVGAYRISRTTGADLVLHIQLGQGNSEQFAVVGWQAGQPALVGRPPADANAAPTDVWYIGSSHGVHEWVTCADGAAVTLNKLSAPTAEGIPIPGGGIREENLFVFDSGAWSPNGSKNVADDNFSYDFNPHTQTFQCTDQAQH